MYPSRKLAQLLTLQLFFDKATIKHSLFDLFSGSPDLTNAAIANNKFENNENNNNNPTICHK